VPGQQPNFDIAVLRTLIAVDELGSFARAAAKVGRSESAVSLQLKRLEEQVGFPVFQRIGRNMALTDAGGALIRNARRLVELNDDAFSTLPSASIGGTVRLGVPPDFAESWLSVALIRIARTFPAIRVQTVVDRSPILVRQLEKSEVDIAITFASEQADDAAWSAILPMNWIGPREFVRSNAPAPLQLAVFDPPCFFRAAASTALDAAGISWNITHSSPNLMDLWAAVSGGLGITVRTPMGLPSQLSVLNADAGLPQLPTVAMVMRQRADGEATPAMSRLTDAMIETLEATLDAAF
jgi:DNA-binding transcriptional LysR family regulator